MDAIANMEVADIYAISFWYANEDDNPRHPKIILSYNTMSNYRNRVADASSEMEAKWNYAFWLQNDIAEIGGENDELLKSWFRETPYFYSDLEDEEAEEDEAEEDEALFDKLLEYGNGFNREFIDVIILLIQRLFREKVIERKFGKSIPVLLHRLEYSDKTIGWVKRANPVRLTNEFVKACESWKKDGVR
ncbi:hypothetical protein [Sinomicrobium sp. M5D2P9]